MEISALSKLNPETRQRFCSILADGGSVTSAAQAIDVSRAALYKARDADPEFAAAWDEAIESGTDALEDEAVRRAKNSSDTLLIFLLKARRPERFKDRVATEHSGAVGVSVRCNYSAYTDDELKA